MSIRTRRIIAGVCIAVSAVLIVLQAALAVTGHPWGTAGFAFAAVSVVSGLMFLRSMRGRS